MKDTTVMVHLEHTLGTDHAVVGPRGLGSDALLAERHDLRDILEHTTCEHTSGTVNPISFLINKIG